MAVITNLGLFALGIAVYLLATRAQDRTGRWALWPMVLLLFLLAVPAVMPPLSLLRVFAVILLLAFGNWVDRHRSLAAA